MIEHVLHLILLLLAARSFGEIATRLGQPALVGEIGAGLILAVLAASLNAPFLAELSRSAFLDLAAEFGIFFLLLLAGLEIAPESCSDIRVARLTWRSEAGCCHSLWAWPLRGGCFPTTR